MPGKTIMCLCVYDGEREREREKAIVVVMIPSGLEGWAEYVEGWGERESVADLQSENRPRLWRAELIN